MPTIVRVAYISYGCQINFLKFGQFGQAVDPCDPHHIDKCQWSDI